MMRIGEVVTTLAISADTLRYYEKIKLIVSALIAKVVTTSPIRIMIQNQK